jgi:hypothetical protein
MIDMTESKLSMDLVYRGIEDAFKTMAEHDEREMNAKPDTTVHNITYETYEEKPMTYETTEQAGDNKRNWPKQW